MNNIQKIYIFFIIHLNNSRKKLMPGAVNNQNTQPIHHHTPTSQPNKLSRFLKALRKVSNDISTRFVDLFCCCFSKPKPRTENTTSKATQDDSHRLNDNNHNSEKIRFTENGLSTSADVTSASPKKQNLSEPPFILTENENIKPKQTFHPDFNLQGSKLEEFYPSGYIYDEPPIIIPEFSDVEYKGLLNSLTKESLKKNSFKMTSNTIARIVKELGGEAEEQISHNSEKLRALMEIYIQGEGVCYGLRTRMALALSQGKTLDQNMLVVDPKTKKSMLKFSEWNEVYKAQTDQSNNFGKNEDILEKLGFKKFHQYEMELQEWREPRSEFFERLLNRITDKANQHKDKDVYITLFSGSNIAADKLIGHASLIMIEKSQGEGKRKIYFYDPNIKYLYKMNEFKHFKFVFKTLYDADKKDLTNSYSKFEDFKMQHYTKPE
ncbi:hypothetical protein [Candidatus Williamhamiltonella defendens]|nr:hypothetical protein [Candidatus Hamiltonella defensa]